MFESKEKIVSACGGISSAPVTWWVRRTLIGRGEGPRSRKLLEWQSLCEFSSGGGKWGTAKTRTRFNIYFLVQRYETARKNIYPSRISFISSLRPSKVRAQWMRFLRLRLKIIVLLLLAGNFAAQIFIVRTVWFSLFQDSDNQIIHILNSRNKFFLYLEQMEYSL